MRFVDTHTHLYDEAFGADADKAVERACAVGVDRMILPDICSSSRREMFDLAGRHPGVLFPCLGLHPTEIDGNWEAELEALGEWKDREIKAIGEIGLDLYWSREFAAQQAEAFRRQLEMAHRVDLPVIIHSRNAAEPLLDILKNCRLSGLRGVFHAYSGSLESWRELSRTGDWMVGIGGVLTFRKASIAETVKSIPLERIVLETDSPYLTPVPHRGERNESSYIPLIASALAGILGLPLEEVAATTSSNAEKLFGI